MLGRGMMGRASGVGASAGLIAVILWSFYSGAGDPLHWPLAAAAAIAGLCGLAILLITLADIFFHRRRSRRIRPVRVFDLALAICLIALSLAQIRDVIGQLPAV
jgi:membrane associated rhomboid family serine protease